MADDQPRRVRVRTSLHQALVEDEEFEVRARSDDNDAKQRPLAKLKEITQSAETPSVDIGANWGRGDARHWLRSTEAGAEPFAFDDEQLLSPSTPVAAEIQAFRASDVVLVELFFA